MKKVDKDLIDDQYGDEEGFEQELCNKEIKNIKQIILDELRAVQETNMKDRETFNKTNINNKAKAQKKLGNLAMWFKNCSSRCLSWLNPIPLTYKL